jgi:hypothetical protein
MRASSGRSNASSSRRRFCFVWKGAPSQVAAASLGRVSDVDLASRLSFFLWSSIPDDELLTAALAGKLHEPAMLDRQISRMLADRPGQAPGDEFRRAMAAARSVKVVTPDCRAFPDSTTRLREAFQQETELFIESNLRENRPVAELLTANYTFLNERLAKHYGVPTVYGTHFRRVTLTDETRFGLLRTGQHPHGHVVRHADLSGPARQVDPGQHPWDASAAPASERAGARRHRRGRQAGVGARATRAAPQESRLRDVPRADGSARFFAGELRRRR